VVFFLILRTSVGAVAVFSRHPTAKAGILTCNHHLGRFVVFIISAFYVIQHYVDPNYRFNGLLTFVRYLIREGTTRDLNWPTLSVSSRLRLIV